jgi:hypothetical protein
VPVGNLVAGGAARRFHRALRRNFSDIAQWAGRAAADGRSPVKEGQKIATVGAQCGGEMLHFEMFRDRSRVPNYTGWTEMLTDRSHATRYLEAPQQNYERRNDLMDPTPYLDAWAQALKSSPREMDDDCVRRR